MLGLLQRHLSIGLSTLASVIAVVCARLHKIQVGRIPLHVFNEVPMTHVLNVLLLMLKAATCSLKFLGFVQCSYLLILVVAYQV